MSLMPSKKDYPLKNINPEIALGAMRLLADGSASADFSSFGLSQFDFKHFVGDKAWVGADRSTVERVVSVLTYGTMDVIGLPRFPVSAEYASAILAMFVHPANIMTACHWSARYQLNNELAEGSPELGAVVATPQQLFATCLLLLEDNPGQFRQKFFKRTGVLDDEAQSA